MSILRMPEREKYRLRIQNLLDAPPVSVDNGSISPETLAHWAKYVCVLISGYLEQSIKEILLAHSNSKAAPSIVRYVERSWPSSKNMKCDAIGLILGHFEDDWKLQFENWLAKDEQRKAYINNIVVWRNAIAHGSERNTNGVTMNAVKIHFDCARELILFIDETVNLSSPL